MNRLSSSGHFVLSLIMSQTCAVSGHVTEPFVVVGSLCAVSDHATKRVLSLIMSLNRLSSSGHFVLSPIMSLNHLSSSGHFVLTLLMSLNHLSSSGHFVLTLVMLGYTRALSIFLMEFVVMFEAPVATAMLCFSLMTAGFALGSESFN